MTDNKSFLYLLRDKLFLDETAYSVTETLFRWPKPAGVET